MILLTTLRISGPIIDDFAGSGTQALRQATRTVQRIHKADPCVDIYYFVLFCTTQALAEISGSGLFTAVDTVFELGDDFRVFSPNSLFFAVPAPGVSQSDAKIVAEHYGRRLLPAHALGYKNGQLIIGFEHNVPNNTLPIFWATGGANGSWVAPFPRHLRPTWS